MDTERTEAGSSKTELVGEPFFWHLVDSANFCLLVMCPRHGPVLLRHPYPSIPGNLSIRKARKCVGSHVSPQKAFHAVQTRMKMRSRENDAEGTVSWALETSPGLSAADLTFITALVTCDWRFYADRPPLTVRSGKRIWIWHWWNHSKHAKRTWRRRQPAKF